MANPVPSGSDVSSGTYECTECGYKLDVGSTKHLPPPELWKWRVQDDFRR